MFADLFAGCGGLSNSIMKQIKGGGGMLDNR